MTDFSQRDPGANVDALFWQRWSPRAFTKTEIADEVLARIVEAARWSPSCFNAQPWRFYTSTAESFDDFLALLVDANQAWARDAAVLGFLVIEKQFSHNGQDNPFARFDAGAAWMSLTLQARMEGLYTHGMGGIHYEAAAAYLGLDSTRHEVVMGFAIGRATDPESLSDEQKQAETPNSRLSLESIWSQC